MSAEEEGMCSRPFPFVEFFKDTPWLNVPMERQAIFIPPLYLRGGLLGGSGDGAPKMSKLQALAAARKKKAQEQKSSSGTGVEEPMAHLSIGQNSSNSSGGKTTPDAKSTANYGPRGFPIRKRKDSNPHGKVPKTPHDHEADEFTPDVSMNKETIDQAEPSAFANTMFSDTSSSPPRRTENLFSLPYVAAIAAIPTSADPFAGPSPDDVVIAAQSKGSANSVRPQK